MLCEICPSKFFLVEAIYVLWISTIRDWSAHPIDTTHDALLLFHTKTSSSVNNDMQNDQKLMEISVWGTVAKLEFTYVCQIAT